MNKMNAEDPESKALISMPGGECHSQESSSHFRPQNTSDLFLKGSRWGQGVIFQLWNLALISESLSSPRSAVTTGRPTVYRMPH